MYRLAGLLAGYATNDVGRVVHRTKRTAIVYALAATLFLFAAGAALAGAGIYLAQFTGAMAAAFIIAAALVVVGLVALIWVILLNRYEKRQHSNSGSALAATAAVALLPSILRLHPALLVAATVGGIAFLATRSGQTESR